MVVYYICIKHYVFIVVHYEKWRTWMWHQTEALHMKVLISAGSHKDSKRRPQSNTHRQSECHMMHLTVQSEQNFVPASSTALLDGCELWGGRWLDIWGKYRPSASKDVKQGLKLCVWQRSPAYSTALHHDSPLFQPVYPSLPPCLSVYLPSRSCLIHYKKFTAFSHRRHITHLSLLTLAQMTMAKEEGWNMWPICVFNLQTYAQKNRGRDLS